MDNQMEIVQHRRQIPVQYDSSDLHSSNQSQMQSFDHSACKGIKSGIINVPGLHSSFEQLRQLISSQISQVRLRVSQLRANRSTFQGKQVVIVDCEDMDIIEKHLESIEDNRQSYEREVFSGIGAHLDVNDSSASHNLSSMLINAIYQRSQMSEGSGVPTEDPNYVRPYDSSHDLTQAQIDNLYSIVKGWSPESREQFFGRFRGDESFQRFLRQSLQESSSVNILPLEREMQSERIQTDRHRDEISKIRQKYRKLKDLYIRQHETSRKLRMELNKIYEKFKK